MYLYGDLPYCSSQSASLGGKPNYNAFPNCKSIIAEKMERNIESVIIAWIPAFLPRGKAGAGMANWHRDCHVATLLAMTSGTAGGFEEASAGGFCFRTEILLTNVLFHDDLIVLFATGKVIIFFIGCFVNIAFDCALR